MRGSKLTDDDIYNIREQYVNGIPQRAIAKKYNVSLKTIYRIVNLKIHNRENTIPQYYKHRLYMRRRAHNKQESQSPIILIGHKKRMGKDTFAKFLKEEFENKMYDVQIIHFADIMKEIVAEMLGITVEQLEECKNNETKKLNICGNESSYRDLLIRFGNGKMKEYFGKTIWRDLLLKRIEKDKIIIVPDFRFPYEMIAGAFTIKVERDNVEKSDDYSENALNSFKFDYVVKNNGSLEDLKEKAKKIVNEILKGK